MQLSLSIAVTILALIAVLIIAWFGIKFLSTLNRLHPSASKRMQIIQTVAIGSRERLVLLRYRERDILLGVSAGGISVLDNSDADYTTDVKSHKSIASTEKQEASKE